MRKAACGEFAQLDALEFREHPAEAFDDLVFKGSEQAFFVAKVVVERAAVQAGARAQVAHREAVDAALFDKRDESFAQRGARASNARVAFGCGGCGRGGRRCRSGSGSYGSGSYGSGGCRRGCRGCGRGCGLAVSLSGWSRVHRGCFDGGIRCRQVSPLGSIIWSIKHVDYYSTRCSIVHYTARKHARQQTMEGL